jgi:hypothetical protein
MDYIKHYNGLMSTRLLLKEERHKKRKNGEYFEGHHIIPKSKGGTGISSKGLKNKNIVYLTAREHFLAHWLLWRIYRDRSSALSFHKMLSCNKNQERIKSSRAYEEARLAFSETNKGNQYGKLCKGKKLSEERKAEISKFMKGRWNGDKNPFFGRKHTDVTKKIISEKRKLAPVESIYNYKGYRRVIKNNEILGVFKTTKDVAEFINCSASNVRHVLCGAQSSANGYLIEYVN